MTSDFLIVSVPHTGTTALANHFHCQPDSLKQWHQPPPRCGHLFERDMSRLITTPCRIITPQRDPLLTAISWETRYVIPNRAHSMFKTTDVMEFYQRLIDLVRVRQVEFFDMAGLKVVNKNIIHNGTVKLYHYYNEKNIRALETRMPKTIEKLRAADWSGIPHADWWL